MAEGRELRLERSAQLKEGRKAKGSYRTIPSYHVGYLDPETGEGGKATTGPGGEKAFIEQTRRESKGLDAAPSGEKMIRVRRSQELKRIRETAKPERRTKRIYTFKR